MKNQMLKLNDSELRKYLGSNNLSLIRRIIRKPIRRNE